ncbi:class I SAM-dependent methyltransferase [Mesorhizobium sp. NBSH29]|uniref:class I SAM-dependent methyltransferase n=1 Tax=Mesorhizobium sp. NBSH29 TaxID=2654249 RepID=UPI0021561B37|nr:class I SAM-dependent methyltransferase [Mesorhizobium sp. NBSH29]
MNRLNWDDRAEIHATDKTGSYQIEKVLAGGSNLFELETRELGDITGKDIIHLQCHIGLDTISLKNMGAASVTGLDFSHAAITAGRDFAAKAGVDVRFVEASLFDATEALEAQTYDIVYVTWGSVNWLDDVFRWARVVASLLKPGGRLYMAEGHPLLFQCNRKSDQLEVEHDWRTPVTRPITWDEKRTYTGDTRPIAHSRYYEWIHPISDVVNALIKAGLALDFLNEHDTVSWQHFPFAVKAGKDMFALPDGTPKIPLAYSIGATKRTVREWRLTGSPAQGN